MSHELTVEHEYAATPEEVFDGFTGMYDEPRPDWVTSARLDLRLGGHWEVAFAPPGVTPFREDRVITELSRPTRLAYSARIVADPAYDTNVQVDVRPHPTGTRITLQQSGFPTEDLRDAFASAWPDVLRMVADRIGA